MSTISESMAATPKTTTVLECCRVAPPPNTHQQTLHPTFFDMAWLNFHQIQRLLFYKFPCSKSHFIETIVPSFKLSLSQTLKHFLPLAGNLIHPLNSELIPEFRYVPGDSVSVTIAQTTESFDFLTGNHPRDADEFYALFPHLAKPEIESGFRIIPLLAIQITLFPEAGICVGFNNDHAVGDASSIVRFIKAWSSIATLGAKNDESLATDNLLPFYDRSVIKDPSGFLNTFWNQMKPLKLESPSPNLPTNKLRSTFILTKDDIQKLKNLVQDKKPGLTHLSSFTVTTAYVWTCLVKSAFESGEKVNDHEPEYFVFAVDARARLSPPAPADYFGNCLVPGFVESTHKELKGDEGFFTAVDLIGEVISKKVNNKEEILRDAEQWAPKFGSMVGKRLFGVAGSPRFDLYDTDFGWGKPEKFEAVSIDGDGSMSLCKSRKFEGGLEIGLSLPKKKIDAFAAIFEVGLRI